MSTSLEPIHRKLVCSTSSSRTYLRHAIAHPLTALPVGFGVLAALYLQSVVVVGVGLVLLLIGAHVVAQRAAFRRAADAEQAQVELARKRRAHQRAFEQAGACLADLADLSDLVSEVTRRTPAQAKRYELEALLDRWAALAVARGHSIQQLRTVDRVALAHTCQLARALHTEGGALQAEIIERRLRLLDHSRVRCERMEHEMGAIAEMVRYLAHRATCPPEPVADDPVARVLEDLDAEDAALASLRSPERSLRAV